MTDLAATRGGRAVEWPRLPYEEWRDTYATLHLYTQVVGKIRLALSPMMNEWWQVPLYVTARGLTTSPIPYGMRTFEIDFDLVDHELVARTSDGETRTLALIPRTVADFYRHVMLLLDTLDIHVQIRPVPVEIPSPTPFERDTQHRAYDAAQVHRFFEVLRRMDIVFKRFRARFTGKCSPVHFFWGSFDLAVTRFSGRLAPPRPGADRINRIAYDEEVQSLGFWPGSPDTGAVVYAYFAPEPAGFSEVLPSPEGAYYIPELREFVLPYEVARTAPQPEEAILAFAESTYAAGAALARWDRAALERPIEGAAHAAT
jgi:hypothetical protein